MKIEGRISWPLSTDLLTKLIERDTSDLDLFADLSNEGTDVEGVTDILRGKKPRVRISKHLSEQKSQNRLRTTLTHEYGHVRFHAPLFAANTNPTLGTTEQSPPKCKRQNIMCAPEYDWMEWQAGYICGSVLMPVSAVRALVRQSCTAANLDVPVSASSQTGMAIIRELMENFGVSEDAARVRLLKLSLLTTKPPTQSLF